MAAWLVRQGGAALSALAAAPLAAAALVVKPAWREGVGERLGMRVPRARGAVWVHAASVGEILAATRLVDALVLRGHGVVASTTTASAREVVGRARPGLPRTFAPFDHPWCVDLALTRVEPAALVLVETELWPSWIAAAARRGIPIAVVSARISDHSYARLRRIAPLVRSTLARLSAVGARTGLDAERFVALGASSARTEVTGDLKLEPLGEGPPLAPELADFLREGAWWVAASTHAGEEDAALDALSAAEGAGARAGLVLAPRRVERASEVARIVAARGRRLWRRSRLSSARGATFGAGEVLLLDTLGELPAVLGGARLVFVGGSLVPVGGHNVLEPALAGRPVLFGPHTEKMREAAAWLVACGGARRVIHAADLAAAVTEWLCNPGRAQVAGEAARGALEPHRGATERSRHLVEGLLAGRDAA